MADLADIPRLLGALRITADPDRLDVLIDQLSEVDEALGLFVRLSVLAETEPLPEPLVVAMGRARRRALPTLARALGPLARVASLDRGQLERGALVAAHLNCASREDSQSVGQSAAARWGLERLRWLTTTHLEVLESPALRGLVGLGTAILDHPRTGPFRTEWGSAIDEGRARQLVRSLSRYPWPGLQVGDIRGRLSTVLGGLARLQPSLSHLVVESPVVQDPVWNELLSTAELQRVTARIPLGAMEAWVAAAEAAGVQRIDLLHGRACAVGVWQGGWRVTLRAARADFLARFGVRILGTLVGVFAPHGVQVILPADLTPDEEQVLARRFRGAEVVVDGRG